MKKDLTYSQEFNALLLQIKQAKQQAFAQVNNILIELYWQIGKTISHKVQSTTWGKSVVIPFPLLNDAIEFSGLVFAHLDLSRLTQTFL